jgi:hypothetical protein
VLPLGLKAEGRGKCPSLDVAAKACPRDVPELPSTANDHRQPHSLNPKETRALNPRATHENTLVMRRSNYAVIPDCPQRGAATPLYGLGRHRISPDWMLQVSRQPGRIRTASTVAEPVF